MVTARLLTLNSYSLKVLVVVLWNGLGPAKGFILKAFCRNIGCVDTSIFYQSAWCHFGWKFLHTPPLRLQDLGHGEIPCQRWCHSDPVIRLEISTVSHFCWKAQKHFLNTALTYISVSIPLGSLQVWSHFANSCHMFALSGGILWPWGDFSWQRNGWAEFWWVLEYLTHWGRVTHICVSKLTIIGSDNGLSPDRRQAITWTNVGILLIGPLGTNFSEILIKILTFSFKKMRMKVPSAKRRPFCLGLNVLNGATGPEISCMYKSETYNK